jgi:hypothetical protein
MYPVHWKITNFKDSRYKYGLQHKINNILGHMFTIKNIKKCTNVGCCMNFTLTRIGERRNYSWWFPVDF